MPRLQATWAPDRHVFLWSPTTAVDDALDELTERSVGEVVSRVVATAWDRVRREPVRGRDLTLAQAVPLLMAVQADAAVSDSVRAWSLAAKLAVELAARSRVVPTVVDGQARWRALLSDPEDRERASEIARGLPPAARAIPTKAQGPVLLQPADEVVRSFLDAVLDGLHRQDVWPGPSRGWVRELADALRGDRAQFRPQDARQQALPERIAAWSAQADAPRLQVGFGLELPPEGDVLRFPLRLLLHPAGRSDQAIPLREGWQSQGSVHVGEEVFPHPAQAALTALARAATLCPALAPSLDGATPRDLSWTAAEAWAFLDSGRPALEAAGFRVRLPASFERAGRHRIRVQIRLILPEGDSLTLHQPLGCRWEVLVGDQILTGSQFAALATLRQPIVQFHGQWVFLDPVEIARLPDDLTSDTELPAAVALRAALTGEHDGVPVVADARLELLLQALRSPPETPAPPGLAGTLRPYQAEGFSWLATLGALGLGACLADDMGLGKTVQLITHVLHRRTRASQRPSLVVCPTSVLGNWQREIARFAPSLRVLRWHGMNRDGRLDAADVVVTTYGLLVRDPVLLAQAWDVVALDEAQAIKNPDSRRAKAASGLVARHRVALTGTPVENRLDELWSLMHFLMPGLLGRRAAFRRNVAVPVERFGDQEVAQRLKLGVAPFLLRRLKTDPGVIDDLPEKVESRSWCALTAEQRALYEDVMEAHLEEIKSAESSRRRGRILAMLTALKQVCNHPLHYLTKRRSRPNTTLTGRSGKLLRLTEILEAVWDNHDRALVFTQYREMGELLCTHLATLLGEPVEFLHGGLTPNRRDQMVRTFQTDDEAAPVLVISLRAGGTGLNLTRASHVVHYDRWWNPAVEDQATDRAHRIGQHQRVQVHKLVTEGTLEERIDSLLVQKRELAQSVIGSQDPAWVTEYDDNALRSLVALAGESLELSVDE